MVNLDTIKTVSKLRLGRGLLIAQKHAPTALTSVGIAGVVVAGVLACKATLKLEERVNYFADVKSHINLAFENEQLDDKDRSKELTKLYIGSSLGIAKLYAPSIAVGIVGISCIVGGHTILRRRNVALAAAYKAVEGSFEEYKKRVGEALGEEKAEDLKYGIKKEKVEGEDGKKTTVITRDPNGHSGYARFFDELNINWSKDREQNLFFLKTQQNYANDRLLATGHLFLNEAYDMLGIRRTPEGAVVGWTLDESGDNFVDFGVFDIRNERARSFVNLEEPAILLDFNVDGTIFDKI